MCEGLNHVTVVRDFSMEGPTDNLSIENEARGEGEVPGRAEEDATQLKSPEEPAPQTDRGPADTACGMEQAASCGPTATEGSPPLGRECSTCLELPSSVTVEFPQPSQAPAPEQCCQRTPKVSVAEMDCLICFNRYSAARLPKLLACQHTFCAICLKLILQNEDHTWIIACPLCRKSTVVFGGLICSLRDKEDVLVRLDSPDPEAETPPPPHPGGTTSRGNRWSISGNQVPQSNRAAAKRLVLLLLLVGMLILFVLPFMYTGMLTWALCCLVVLGLIVSAILCCNPSSNFFLPPCRKKQSYVVSVA